MSKGGKTVSIKVPQSKLNAGADAWIANRGAEPPTSDREGGATVTPLNAGATPPVATEAPKEKIIRMSIDVSESLHRRVKGQCAARGVRMVDVVRDFFEREFPEK